MIEKDDPESCNHMTHKSTDVMPCTRERTDFCYCCGVEISPDYPHAELDKSGTVQKIIALIDSPRRKDYIDDTGLTSRTSRTECFKIVEQCSWAMLPWCKREGSQAVVGADDDTSRPSRLMPRLDCLVRTSET